MQYTNPAALLVPVVPAGAVLFPFGTGVHRRKAAARTLGRAVDEEDHARVLRAALPAVQIGDPRAKAMRALTPGMKETRVFALQQHVKMMAEASNASSK